MEYIEKTMTVREMHDEWVKCVNDPEYAKKYIIVKDDDGVIHIDIPDWLKAFDLIQPIDLSAMSDSIKAPMSACMDPQRIINRVVSDINARTENKKP